MLSTIIFIIIGLIVVLLIVAATKPNSFRVERFTNIKSTPNKIFSLINDFHNWQQWSPFEKLDPTMKKNYSGSENGKGAVYEWKGNNKAGAGRMEIIESNSPTKIVITIIFTKPFKAENTIEFSLEPQGNSTKATWAMYGSNSFMSKIMSIFIGMDKLVGKDFEAGLANLKTVAEE